MIQLSRNYSLPEKKEDDFAIKIVGVGGAGSQCARPHRARRHGERRNDCDQHRCAIARQFGRDAKSADRSRRDARAWRRRGSRAGYNAAHESADELREALARRADGFYLRRARRRNRFGRGAGRCTDGARNRSARRWLLPRCLLRSKANVAARRRQEALARVAAHRGRRDLFRERSHGRHGRCRKREFTRLSPSPTRPSARAFARSSTWSGGRA